MEAIVCAGGDPISAPGAGALPRFKGMQLVGEQPMASYAVAALRGVPEILDGGIVLVGEQVELRDPLWAGVRAQVLPARRHIESARRGIEALKDPSQPCLLLCGDVVGVTTEGIASFIRRFRERSLFERSDCMSAHYNHQWEPARLVDVCYGYVRQEAAERQFGRVPHTWVRLRGIGRVCSAGVGIIYPSAFEKIATTLDELSGLRKNVLALASWLGWWNIVRYLFNRVTLQQLEWEMGLRLGVTCIGVEAPGEFSFNIDDAVSLARANQRFAVAS